MDTWWTGKADFGSGVNLAQRISREIPRKSPAEVDAKRKSVSTTRKLLRGLSLQARTGRFRVKWVSTYPLVRERSIETCRNPISEQ